MDTLVGRASRRQQTPRHLVRGTTCPEVGRCPGQVGTACPVTRPRVLGTMAPMPLVPEGRATSKTPLPSVEPDVVTRSSMLAVVAGALTVTLTAGSILLGLADDVPPAAPGLAGAVFGVTGGLVASRRPRLVIGWMLLVVGLSLALSSFCLDWARHALVVDPGSLPAGELALWLGTWVWVVGYCVLAALLPLRLPDGAHPVGVWRVVWWAALAVTALAVAGWALTPYDQLDRPPLDGLDPSVTTPTGTAIGPVLLAASLPLLAVCSVAGLISLVQRLRRSVGEERQQAKWVVWGAVLSLALLALGQVFGPEGGSDVLLAVAVLPLPLGIAVASLRYRLWDVDLVINRTLVYAVLTSVVVAVYVVVVLAVGDLLGDRTGAPLAATVLVALGAEPVHRRVQRFVDRVARGDRADPYRALVRLGQRLEAASEPVGPQALRGSADAVRHALQLPWVVVEVDDGPSSASGTPASDGIRVPLVYSGTVVGYLEVGPRRVGRPLSHGDLRLLDDLARHVAVAAHAVQLREALQTSRERIVTAREEERRRLRRDLHDDLGPVLAAVALQVGEVRSRTTDEEIATLSARAESLLTGAVATVRRIVDGLRPAALDDLGLSEAMHAVADGFATPGLDVRVEVRGNVVGLPAAVEVAALRVATEALHNAARHSGARKVRLGVERVTDALEVTVADDGRGLPPAPTPGVGMVSMRERAEEIGGTCTVAPGPAGGTLVLARLPVPDTLGAELPPGRTGAEVEA